MTHESVFSRFTDLSTSTLGVFRGCAAVRLGVTRKQLGALRSAGVIERVHPDTYRVTVVARSPEQDLRAALLWAGDRAVAAGRSAGEVYGLEGVRAPMPEIVVPRRQRLRAPDVIVHRSDDRSAMMVRHRRGILVTGMEATLVSLAHSLDAEAFEVAFEDARRRRFTSIPALRAYLARFGAPGRVGTAKLRSHRLRDVGQGDPASGAAHPGAANDNRRTGMSMRPSAVLGPLKDLIGFTVPRTGGFPVLPSGHHAP